MKIISLVLVIAVLLPFLAWGESYPHVKEAIEGIFPSFQDYKVENYILDDQELKVFTVFSDKKIMGWAVILDEMGKIKPITFLVGIDIKGSVLGIRILEYRDIFGSEIKRKSFLRQFQGKSSKDSMEVGRDIDAVTGATISSHAATSAVKKSLEMIEKIKVSQKFDLN